MSVISAVKTEFIQKLKDVVAIKGERARMTFSTDNTAPDLSRSFLNGTDVTLVSYGNVDPEQRSITRFNITCIPRKSGGFDVSMDIFSVEPQDAGTYLAKDENDQEYSEKNSVEFIVIGKTER